MAALQWLKNKISVYGKFDAHYLFRHARYMIMGNGVILATNIVTAVALTTFLPIETYGKYAYLLAIVGLFGSFMLNGINNAVTQAVARGENNVLATAISLQARWLVPIAVIFVAYCIYLYAIGTTSVFIISLLILGTSFFTASSLSVAGAFLFGKKEFKRLGYTAGIFAIVTCIIVSAAAFTENIIVLCSAYAASSLMSAGYLYYHAKRVSKPEKRDIHTERSLMRFGIHLSALSVLSSIAENIDKITIFFFLGPLHLALYFFTVQITDAGKALIKSVISIFIPRIAVTDMGVIRTHLTRHIFIGMAAGGALTAAYWIAIPYAITIFFPRYQEAAEYVKILSMGFIFIVPITYTAYVLQSHTMITDLYISSIVPNTARIALYAVSAAYAGIIGLLICQISIYIVSLTLNTILLNRGYTR